jgi:hypothetical protein
MSFIFSQIGILAKQMAQNQTVIYVELVQIANIYLLISE